MIEGAKMIVCQDCTKLGVTYWEEQRPRHMKRTAKLPLGVPSKAPPPTVTETLELVESHSSIVRQEREKRGMSHEELGKKIGEKVSVLQKIESGKMIPDIRLTQKLEHALRIRLLVPPKAKQLLPTKLTEPHEATLGDFVKLKRNKSEATEEREQS
jgi:putative transcription factor